MKDVETAWNYACGNGGLRGLTEGTLSLNRITNHLKMDKQPEAPVRPTHDSINAAVATTASKMKQLWKVHEQRVEQEVTTTSEEYQALQQVYLELGVSLKKLLHAWLKQKKQYANRRVSNICILDTQAQYGAFQQALEKCRAAFRDFNQQGLVQSVPASASSHPVSADMCGNQATLPEQISNDQETAEQFDDERQTGDDYHRRNKKQKLAPDRNQLSIERCKVAPALRMFDADSSTCQGYDEASARLDEGYGDEWRPGLGVDQWNTKRQASKATPEYIVIDD